MSSGADEINMSSGAEVNLADDGLVPKIAHLKCDVFCRQIIEGEIALLISCCSLTEGRYINGDSDKSLSVDSICNMTCESFLYNHRFSSHAGTKHHTEQ